MANSSCGSCVANQGCLSLDGCIPGVCPDFLIKRHDTKPSFRVSVEDCDGALDLTDVTLVLESNMWAKAKLKTAITNLDVSFALADNIGFEQIAVGDVIVIVRARLPEHMLVTGFDETNNLVFVDRGYHGTTATAWKKGTQLKIFKFINASASIETVYQDIPQVDGTTKKNQLVETFLMQDWTPEQTCLSGCYWLEFKLLKMADLGMDISPSVTPSVVPSLVDYNCGMGLNVEWVRRFPEDSEGFLIKIMDSFTAEI